MNFNPTPYIVALVIVVLGAIILGQRTDIARAETALANERTAHATTKGKHAEVLADYSTRFAKQAEAFQRAQGLWQTAESARDHKFTQEVQHERDENERLRSRPAVRVRIPGACPAPSPAAGGGQLPAVPAASGVEPAAVEVTGPARQRVFDLRGSVRVDAKRLAYLQEYGQACAEGRPPPEAPAP